MLIVLGEQIEENILTVSFNSDQLKHGANLQQDQAIDFCGRYRPEPMMTSSVQARILATVALSAAVALTTNEDSNASIDEWSGHDFAYHGVTLNPGEHFVGLTSDLEVATYFNTRLSQFSGELRNQKESAICDILLSIVVGGANLESVKKAEFVEVEELGKRGKTVFAKKIDVSFESWRIEIQWSTKCEEDSSETRPIETEELGESEIRQKTRANHNGQGVGEILVQESVRDRSLYETLDKNSSGTFGDQKYSFAFDFETGTFRGSVGNSIGEVICSSTSQINLTVNEEVLELGATIPNDLQSGETIEIVMDLGFPSSKFEDEGTYTILLKSSSCATEGNGD